jgi:hypothetical protein
MIPMAHINKAIGTVTPVTALLDKGDPLPLEDLSIVAPQYHRNAT